MGIKVDRVYDAGPTGCGELIMNLFLTVKKMKQDEVIKVISYDLGAREDVPAWCRLQGHELIDLIRDGEQTCFFIQKGEAGIQG